MLVLSSIAFAWAYLFTGTNNGPDPSRGETNESTTERFRNAVKRTWDNAVTSARTAALEIMRSMPDDVHRYMSL